MPDIIINKETAESIVDYGKKNQHSNIYRINKSNRKYHSIKSVPGDISYQADDNPFAWCRIYKKDDTLPDGTKSQDEWKRNGIGQYYKKAYLLNEYGNDESGEKIDVFTTITMDFDEWCSDRESLENVTLDFNNSKDRSDILRNLNELVTQRFFIMKVGLIWMIIGSMDWRYLNLVSYTLSPIES